MRAPGNRFEQADGLIARAVEEVQQLAFFYPFLLPHELQRLVPPVRDDPVQLLPLRLEHLVEVGCGRLWCVDRAFQVDALDAPARLPHGTRTLRAAASLADGPSCYTASRVRFRWSPTDTHTSPQRNRRLSSAAVLGGIGTLARIYFYYNTAADGPVGTVVSGAVTPLVYRLRY